MSTWKGIAIVAPLSCELTGKGRWIGRESKKRCLRAIRLCHKLEDSGYLPVVILSGGWDPWGRYPEQKQPIAWLMRDFLVDHGIPGDRIRISELIWNTGNEVAVATRYRTTLAEANNGVLPPIYFVTSWYHLLRVMWHARFQHHTHARYRSVWSGSVMRVLLEPVKPILYMLLRFKRRIVP